ncbi:5-(carboxyamino)imidazole ribonucleotide mutase [Leptospira sp. WS39.C2]
MTNHLPKVAVIMGSFSDWETMKEACDILTEFGIPFEKEIVSAHRSPERMFEFARNAKNNGFGVIIAGAGGAAHLPGMTASLTTLPVLGVPVLSKALSGMDSLLSIVQMPKGVPVATLAIGTSGAANAGLLAVRILSLLDTNLTKKLEEYAISNRNSAMSKNDQLF